MMLVVLALMNSARAKVPVTIAIQPAQVVHQGRVVEAEGVRDCLRRALWPDVLDFEAVGPTGLSLAKEYYQVRRKEALELQTSLGGIDDLRQLDNGAITNLRKYIVVEPAGDPEELKYSRDAMVRAIDTIDACQSELSILEGFNVNGNEVTVVSMQAVRGDKGSFDLMSVLDVQVAGHLCTPLRSERTPWMLTVGSATTMKCFIPGNFGGSDLSGQVVVRASADADLLTFTVASSQGDSRASLEALVTPLPNGQQQ